MKKNIGIIFGILLVFWAIRSAYDEGKGREVEKAKKLAEVEKAKDKEASRWVRLAAKHLEAESRRTAGGTYPRRACSDLG